LLPKLEGNREKTMDRKTKPKLLDFVGMPYTTELGRQMPYGAVIDSRGIIKRVMTEEDYPEL
jgi:hypothetical protein